MRIQYLRRLVKHCLLYAGGIRKMSQALAGRQFLPRYWCGAVRVTAKAVNDGFVFALKFDGVRLGVAGEDAHGGYVWRHLRCASGSRENWRSCRSRAGESGCLVVSCTRTSAMPSCAKTSGLPRCRLREYWSRMMISAGRPCALAHQWLSSPATTCHQMSAERVQILASKVSLFMNHQGWLSGLNQ